MQNFVELILLIIALLVVGLAYAEIPEKVDYGLVKADNEFGFSLFNGLTERSPHENVFISPLSISMALQMCYSGADSKTKAQMGEVMKIAGMPVKAVNSGNRQLIEYLTRGEDVRLEIANSLWAKKEIPFHHEFVDALEEYYHAVAYERDFEDPAVVEEINSWVAEKTHDKIKQIIQQLDPLAILVLINAVYFKGAWFDQFNENVTEKADFYLHDGTIQKVDMMFKRDDYSYLETKEFQAVKLPYKDPRFEMVIFLPSEGTDLNDFLIDKDADWWSNRMSQFREREGNLYFPRFKVEYEIELNDPLIAMGMSDAFTAAEANFTKMTPFQPAWISSVIHKTYLEVDEEGTEAAAVTTVMMAGSAAPEMDPPEPFTMRVDRPFFCAIIERNSGAMLFMGAIYIID